MVGGCKELVEVVGENEIPPLFMLKVLPVLFRLQVERVIERWLGGSMKNGFKLFSVRMEVKVVMSCNYVQEKFLL